MVWHKLHPTSLECGAKTIEAAATGAGMALLRIRPPSASEAAFPFLLK